MRCTRPAHGNSVTSQPRATLMLRVFILAFGLSAQDARSWDATPNDFLILDPPATVATAMAAVAAGKLTFDEGVQLRLGCYYTYQGGADVPPPWRIEFSVDGKPVGSVQAQGPKIGNFTDKEEYVTLGGIQSETTTSQKLIAKTYYAEVKWTASGDGPRNVQCLLNPDKVAGESNLYNNIAQHTITIRRLKPRRGGDQLPVNTTSSRASGAAAIQMEIEAEALAKSGAIQVTGGQAQPQPMTGFGTGWSGGEQLFWHGGSAGAVLDLIIDVPVASKYALEIYLTRAPDYGALRFEVDGKASGTSFDGVAPQVLAPGPTQLGTFPLQAGARRVSIMITGKHAQSTGHFAGIDKLRLYPAGPID